MKAQPISLETMFFKCESTEMLFHHSGHPMTIYILDKEDVTDIKDLQRVILGQYVEKGNKYRNMRTS